MAVLPFDDRDGSIWYDGGLVPWRAAQTHVLTHGLHYASSVFEGQRIYRGQIYKLAEHTARLFESARIMDMTIPFTEEQINEACLEVARVQGLEDGYMRPLVFRGSEMMSVAAPNAKIHVAIAAWPWPSYFSPEEKRKGIRLTVSDWRRPAPDTAPTRAKAAGLYMICTISKHAAERQGFADALMYDYRGFIAEATGANVFFAKDGALHTPIPDCFLDGITRKSVISLAHARQSPVFERHIEPAEMAGFEECFLTGTAAEVTPVSQVGPYQFVPGRMCETMMEDYANDVRGIFRSDAI
jgi:branched-chain amino acid aminotransferase